MLTDPNETYELACGLGICTSRLGGLPLDTGLATKFMLDLATHKLTKSISSSLLGSDRTSASPFAIDQTHLMAASYIPPRRLGVSTDVTYERADLFGERVLIQTRALHSKNTLEYQRSCSKRHHATLRLHSFVFPCHLHLPREFSVIRQKEWYCTNKCCKCSCQRHSAANATLLHACLEPCLFLPLLFASYNAWSRRGSALGGSNRPPLQALLLGSFCR